MVFSPGTIRHYSHELRILTHFWRAPKAFSSYAEDVLFTHSASRMENTPIRTLPKEKLWRKRLRIGTTVPAKPPSSRWCRRLRGSTSQPIHTPDLSRVANLEQVLQSRHS